jgi:hypothetical protein
MVISAVYQLGKFCIYFKLYYLEAELAALSEE